MSRFELLEKELNKSQRIEERGGSVIPGWSPNNIRRLVVGTHFALVQYFVTGGKYNRTFETVDLKDKVFEDVQLVKEGKTYRALLSVLTAGRICSSIEEIYFCTPGYPSELLQRDLSVQPLAGGVDKLATRFVRLQFVGVVHKPIEEFATLLHQNSGKGETVGEAMLADPALKASLNVVYRGHEEDGYRNTALRPKYYPFDEEKLAPYFESVRLKVEAERKTEQRGEIEESRKQKALLKYGPMLELLSGTAYRLEVKLDQLTGTTNVIDRMEWAFYVPREARIAQFRKDLTGGDAERYRELRKMSADALLPLFAEKPEVLKMLGTLKESLTDTQGSYVREDCVSDVVESLRLFVQLSKMLVRFYVNVIYSMLHHYLYRNTEKYVEHYLETLTKSADLSGLVYTRTIIEWCNRNSAAHIGTPRIREVFKRCSFVEVLEEQYTPRIAEEESLKVLTALLGRNGELN